MTAAAREIKPPRDGRWVFIRQSTVCFLDVPDQKFDLTLWGDRSAVRVEIHHSVIREDLNRWYGDSVTRLEIRALEYIEARALDIAAARLPTWPVDIGPDKGTPICDMPDWYLQYCRRTEKINTCRRQAAEAEIARRSRAKQEVLTI